MDNKNVILGKDLCWIVGTEKDNEENVVIIPFIYNKNRDKVKVLIDNKIYNLDETRLAMNVLCSAYNINYIEDDYYDIKSWTYNTTKFIAIKPKDKISQKKLYRIIKDLKTTYLKTNKHHLKCQKLAEKRKNFEESYKNF